MSDQANVCGDKIYPKTEIINARITAAVIHSVSDAIFVDLVFDYGSAGQGLNRMVWKQGAHKHHPLMGAAFIFRLMEIAGVTEWQKMVGNNVRVEREVGLSGLIRDVGHILDNRWLGVVE